MVLLKPHVISGQFADLHTHLSAETKIAAGKCIDQLLREERS